MSITRHTNTKRAAETRLAAGVVIVAMLLWMGISWAGGVYEWPRRFAFLADLAALAAFAWAGIVLFRLWRTREKDE